MRILFVFSLLLISLTISAQQQPRKIPQEYLDYDYLTHEYEHLNKDYKINIPSAKFDSIVTKFRFIPERIDSWKDSLGVVLVGEFGNWDQGRIASNRITYSHLKSSYYLWITPEEAKQMAEKRGFKHPYRFYEYFRFHKDKWDDEMKQFMKDLRDKVAKASERSNVAELNQRKFLSEALKINPKRIEDFLKVREQRMKERRTRR
ncbi:hypothetical protein [Marinifilum caeruleilacunae]|uniref:Uncharacterized protein n=1 Tax=Marinifilum caeruleilacunae TaxID=2499076 RepID=A0ABX1WRS4_9BACT|nr:hypothetical protein [Marinifilum caeruleilacunae]NOU58670.1 hypothetical protein [Marinifilum caeruleilacunae]